MTRLRPAIQVTVDGQDLTGPEAAIAHAEIRIGRGGAQDVARLAVGELSPIVDASPGASFVIALGYDDDPTAVLTGTITAVDRAVSGAMLSAVASTLPLSRARVAQSYVDQKVADVVQDLLGRAEVDVGEIDAPLSLSAYHVDERRTIWRHLQELARLSGCEMTTTPEGALNFRPEKSGSSDHLLRRGAELAGWLLLDRDAPESPWKVAPFGAASEAGKEKWQLVLKAPAGDAPDSPYLIPAALRDRDGASQHEEALAKAAAARKNGGRLAIPGDASIRAGDLLELEDVDGFEQLRAIEVVHQVGARGFLTDVRVEAA